MRFFVAIPGLALRIALMVLIGLAWAAAWSPLGALLNVIWDPAAASDRVFVPVGAPPGLLCGVCFFVMLALGEARQRLDEVPLHRAGVWGTVVGVFVGALPFGMSQPTSDLAIELLVAETIGPVALLSAASAIATVLLARLVKDLGGSALAA